MATGTLKMDSEAGMESCLGLEFAGYDDRGDRVIGIVPYHVSRGDRVIVMVPYHVSGDRVIGIVQYVSGDRVIGMVPGHFARESFRPGLFCPESFRP